MFTTDKQKNRMRGAVARLNLYNPTSKKFSPANFDVSRPDWNGGKVHLVRMSGDKAYRLIEMGYTVSPAADQSTRAQPRPRRVPLQKLEIDNAVGMNGKLTPWPWPKK